MRAAAYNPAVLIIIGLMLAASSTISFVPQLRKPHFARERKGWLSLIAIPIGIETGFSSAGAGALGAILLLNFSELLPAQVVGTDLSFGIILAVVGSALHLGWGSVSGGILFRLLAGGIPGVVLGGIVSRRLKANRLRLAIAVIGLALGLQLVWTGGKTLWQTTKPAQLEALRWTK
jgi:hypothetical protein